MDASYVEISQHLETPTTSDAETLTVPTTKANQSTTSTAFDTALDDAENEDDANHGTTEDVVSNQQKNPNDAPLPNPTP